MKPAILSLLIAGLLIPLAANAQIGWPQDTVGLFFDTDGGRVHAWLPPYYPTSMYLVLLEPSAVEGVIGWGCTIQFDGCFLLIGWYPFGTDPVFITSPPEYMIYLSDPLPVMPAVPLMQIDFMVLCSDCVSYEILPFPELGDPPLIAYFDSADPETPIPMNPLSFGDPPLINCDIVPTADRTWGSVKSIYL